MTIKQIFLDMDGTLLNQQGTVSDDNRRTIADSVCSVTLVSARAPMEMQATIQQLALTAPQIAFNGGLSLIHRQEKHWFVTRLILN